MLFQWSLHDLLFRDEMVLLTISVLTDQGCKPHFQLDTDATVYGLGIDTGIKITEEDDSLLRVKGELLQEKLPYVL